MIRALEEGIANALYQEFGDGYTILREDDGSEQRPPYFTISCQGPSSRLFFGKRYFLENQFCIRYVPENKAGAKEECNTTASRLFSCLEWLDVAGAAEMGTKMHYEVVDGILHFFVNYDRFVYKEEALAPAMESVTSNIFVKG